MVVPSRGEGVKPRALSSSASSSPGGWCLDPRSCPVDQSSGTSERDVF